MIIIVDNIVEGYLGLEMLLWLFLESKIWYSVNIEINKNNDRISVGGRESELGVKTVVRKNNLEVIRRL